MTNILCVVYFHGPDELAVLDGVLKRFSSQFALDISRRDGSSPAMFWLPLYLLRPLCAALDDEFDVDVIGAMPARATN
jgi:hypothetical protein